MAEEFPSELKTFITEHIQSVAKLETLLLLYENSQRWWSAADAARAIYIAETPTAALLAELHSAGLLAAEAATPPLYRFEPKNPKLVGLVADLAKYYQQRRVTVITMIHSAPVDKLRTFADAFKIIRPPKDT